MADSIRIDVDRLRAALLDEFGTAAFAVSPFAMGDLLEVEDASPEELVRIAEREGMDLARFAVE